MKVKCPVAGCDYTVRGAELPVQSGSGSIVIPDCGAEALSVGAVEHHDAYHTDRAV